MTELPGDRPEPTGSGLLAELGRRKVFRVAGAYAVAAWVMMQAAEITFPAFELPNSALRTLIIVLGLGLPIAILLAWLIEVTPAGIRFAPGAGDTARSASGTDTANARSIHRIAEVVLLGLCLPALGFGGLLLVLSLRDGGELAAGATEALPATLALPIEIPEQSIAVLPFEGASAAPGGAGPDDEFFARGIHEDLLSHLARLRDLKVISRTSVLPYAERRAGTSEIGRALGVAHVLEGSVRRSGERVRVWAQLSRAESGEQLWADSFDAELRDVFAVQSQIARRIADALEAKLGPEAAATLDRVPTRSPAAYDAYLRARDLHRNLDAGDRATLERTAALYGRALELDPEFAEAWAQQAILYAEYVWFGVDPSPARAERARSALERARAIEPNLAMLPLAEGIFAYYCERDYTRALFHFGAALERSPGDAAAIFYRAMILRRTATWPEAIAAQRRALELDPLNLAYQDELALTLALSGRLEEAHALLHGLLERDPGRTRARFTAWQLDLELHGEPDRVLDEILASDRDQWGSQHQLLLETVAVLAGREREAIEVIETRPVPEPDSGYREFQRANLERFSGRTEHASELLERSWRAYLETLASRPDALPEPRRSQIEASFAAARGEPDRAIALQLANVEREPIERDAVLGSPPLALLLHFALAAGRVDESLALLERLEQRVAYGSLPSGGYFVLAHWPEYESIRADPVFARALAERLPAYASRWPRE